MKRFMAGDVEIGNGFFVIAGPCVIESEKLCMDTAEALKEACEREDTGFIFKSSYLKANRTSPDSYTGPGIYKGLDVLKKVRRELGVPVLTDVHCVEEVDRCAAAADVLQIPAFLCRQTPLITKAAGTGLPVNVKKGQFLAPGDVVNIIRKVESAGNDEIIITERGVSFGYNNLVVDMRGFPVMREFGYPVVFDATHSVQIPGGLGSSSGGERKFVLPLARAAAAAGCDGLFLEIHPSPGDALCDGANMLSTGEFAELLAQVKSIVSALGEKRG